ncbi:MAG: ribonuclease R [Saprospiraceae bacterium]|nr:ribonuclease R [Saprospiraceae bacterium]
MSKKKYDAIDTKLKLTVSELQRAIVITFQEHLKKNFNAAQLIKKLNISNNKDAVNHALIKLCDEGILIAIEDEKYKYNRNSKPQLGKHGRKFVEGYVDMTRNGSAFIVCEGEIKDIFVHARHLNSAMNGDKVRVALFPKRNGSKRPEGEVSDVLERATETFIGKVQIFKNFAIVVPSHEHIHSDIFVPLSNCNGAQHDDIVVVKVTNWLTKGSKGPEGKITQVLGKEHSSDIAMQSILLNNGFDLGFSEETLAEVEKISSSFDPKDMAQRRDMREICTFTIDPEDAKDFDDAISFQQLENGNYEIGVHIADVSYYVKEGTFLDKDARRSSTSVYLVDRVLPMLPEKLSNELCSLRPNEDKLTFSAIFEITQNAKIINRWFGRTIIHSKRRFSYEEAQHILETNEGDLASELKIINSIATKLRNERFKNGAINFESDEVKFKLDENGIPLSIYIRERKDAHLLIEDFMLLANKEVATFMVEKQKNQAEIPFIYRVHDLPDFDRILEFTVFALEMGYKMHIDSPEQIAKALNELAEASEKDDRLKLLTPIAIRTMAKAEYSTENIGHYGLAFKNYTHFTSPIRRYSDILAHRILYKNLVDTYRCDKAELEALCKHISKQEKRAVDAERESTKYKQVEFMSHHVGQEFEGWVSGFNEKGIFVELILTRSEGLVLFSSLPEQFDIQDNRLKAKGRNSGKIIRMGDIIKVKVDIVDIQNRKLTLSYVSS